MSENQDEANEQGDATQREAEENLRKQFTSQSAGGSESSGPSNNSQDQKGSTLPQDDKAGTSTQSSNIEHIKGETVNIDQKSDISHHIGDTYIFLGSSNNLEMLQKGISGPYGSVLKNIENDPTLRIVVPGSRADGSESASANEDTGSQKAKDKPPETPEKIHHWYCEKLTDWEACFVQAAVVLHGAPVYQIRDAAATLASKSISASRVSETALLEHTCTQIEWAAGAERLFWYDRNEHGLSTFAAQVLLVVVRQSSLSVASQPGQNFLKRLEAWTTTLSGECAWRATHALGAVWKKIDEARLLRIANEWARSYDPDDWHRAAILLDGAYEVEYAERGEQIWKENKSLVLGLLNQWTREAHTSFQAHIGSTIAQTYLHIGQRSLTPALNGLDALLRYPLRNKDDSEVSIPLLVFIFTALSYVTLARFGSAREILAHMASLVAKCSYQRRLPQDKERREYLGRCKLIREALFLAFFLIANASFSGVRGSKPGNYERNAVLPDPLIIPSENNQDILLAGILSSKETAWRHHIMTILCAAIIEANAQPAFYLMRVWAEITLNETGLERSELREAYLNFLLEAEEKGNQWCSELARAGEYKYENLSQLLYKETLERWNIEGRKNGQFIGAFAKDVARRLKV